jgi:organic hydroperoxide reductase OsmC/OhrA
MSEHKAVLAWERVTESFTYEKYNRDHVWRFDNGTELGASATPAYLGNPAMIDPEEAFAASISSCHLLTFLALACKQRFVLDRYDDEASAFVEKDRDGKHAVTRVTLRPRVIFSGAKQPTDEALAKLHHDAHELCFIANSVKAEITVEPRTT